jgi:hypothetical protein
MDEPEFRARLNPQTGRWDVIRRRPDGTELVIQSYELSEDAKDEVARLRQRKAGRLP